MRVVIDTNVLVSALLRRGTPPAEVVDALLNGRITLLYDQRIFDEYREVLLRPKFAFDPEDVEALLRFITSAGEFVPNARFAESLPDLDDQPFADVAFSGSAEALITGNKAHFPIEDAIRVVTPREWVELTRQR